LCLGYGRINVLRALTAGPVNTVPGAQTVAQDTALTIGGISVTVVDGILATTQLTVTNGRLVVSLASGATISAGANSSATLTLSGAQADINATLATLSYRGNPYYFGPDTLTVTSRDTNELTDVDQVAITVTPINHPPVNTVPRPQTVAQNTSLLFSGGNGNLIAISDVDAGSNPLSVALTGTNGTITLSGTGGLTFSIGDGVADGKMAFTGMLTDINAALAGLSFRPTANFTGAASLLIVTNDQGNTGTGGPLSDSDTVSITVTPINQLSALSVSPGSLIPVFAPHTVNYTVNVATDVTSVTFTATKSDPNAVMVINGSVTARRGVATGQITIRLPGPGTSTLVTITLTDQNGSNTIYRITVNRAIVLSPPQAPVNLRIS